MPGKNPVILTPGMPDFYSGTKWERKPSGHILMDGIEIADTLMCPHCNGHFISRAGSGHRRTYCYLCQAVTCGSPACDHHSQAHQTWEQQFEAMEKRG